MARRSYANSKGRKSKGRFLSLPHDALNHPKYISLSYSSKSLLIEIAMQYNGFNNGDISIPWSRMQKRGWRSEDTLNKNKKELIGKGFITQTRQGGKNRCSLFAINWEAINECGGKLDISSTKVPSFTWKSLP